MRQHFPVDLILSRNFSLTVLISPGRLNHYKNSIRPKKENKKHGAMKTSHVQSGEKQNQRSCEPQNSQNEI